MKKQFFFISFFIGLSLIMGLSSCEDKDISDDKKNVSGIENGHEYVDLGLSVKWATCNVGATKPEAFGDYFAWGETSPKNSYTESNYTYSNNPSTLPLNKDAASVNMGGKWRMPTKKECQELIEKCSLEQITQNGVYGYKVIGPNGNFIFLPAAGYRSRDELSGNGTSGCYWSSSSHKDEEGNEDFNYAHYLSFYSDLVRVSYYNRCNGFTIRGVWQKKESESEGGSEE